jgi:hypothetical protein
LSSRARLVHVPDDPVETLQRWEAAGGHWEVVSRGPSRLVVSLLRCDGGEEASRLNSSSPALAAFIGERQSST